jgi:hypothetical protein
MPNLDKWFSPFEGTRDPYPLAVFRIAFFAGVALHFFPSLLWLDIGYGRGAVRDDAWNHWLYSHLWRVSPVLVRGFAIITMAAIVAGLVGARPRIAAIVAGIGCYTFASWNSIHLQTLALIPTWAIFMLWMICGGGDAVLSILGKRRDSEPRLLGSLILFQILLAVFFSGVEKLLAGWPLSNEMAIVLAYPKGFITRDWVVALPFLHGPVVSTAFTWLTLVVELGAPIALLVRRTRVIALIVWELFFLGIIAMLEVPPLFYFIFAAGPLLALDADQVKAARARVAKVLERTSS